MKPKILILEAIHERGVAALQAFAEVDIRLGLERAAQLAIIGDYDAIIVRSVIAVDEEFIARSTNLKAVGRAGTGTENINLPAAGKRGIKVFTVPAGNSISAAEFTIALMFCLTRNLSRAFSMTANNDFRRALLEGREFTNLKIGLVGLGNVGMAVAKRLHPFGCQIFGVDPEPMDGETFAATGGQLVKSFEELIGTVDVLSFHVRVTDETSLMLNQQTLARIKPGLLLVNTSRAHVIDDASLIDALNDGRVAAAALDVLHPEPPFDALPGQHTFKHQLMSHPNVITTPHMAASTEDAQYNIAIDLSTKLNSFFNHDIS
jgi:D-3-phosphoglycerate dehydrogenase / 2-oxoglutarate reductase